MDPLTHTLVGANLAATRLRDTTRFAAAALVIGVNAPDIDAVTYAFADSDFSLGFRRGWTHGVLALVVLPFVLTGSLLLYDRLRPSSTAKARAGWLLLLSTLAVLTHPFLDWLNTYGMRWLMPFDGTWFYGDSVFIMDPLLWIVLGAGWLAGRTPSPGLIAIWAFFTAAISWVVSGRNMGYLIIVGVIALVLLAALLWRPADPKRIGRKLATSALIVATVYIGGRLAVHQATESSVRGQLAERGLIPSKLLASPHPFNPLHWDVVAEVGPVYRYGNFDWRNGELVIDDHQIPLPEPSPLWDAARSDPSVQGFMDWVRFPWYEVRRSPEGTFVHIMDARRARRATTGFGGVVVRVDETAAQTR